MLGCDVGQSEIDGFSDGWLLGFALILGFSDGMEDGLPDILGFSDGLDVGQSEIEGFSDGLDCWMVMRSCVCHHREMREMCMTTLVFNEHIYEYKFILLTWELGTPEILGFMLGCDVGQSDTDGFSDGWLLGFALTDGDSDGIEDGWEVGYRNEDIKGMILYVRCINSEL